MNEETSLMWQIACFCVCGALLGVLYEPLRILRLIIPHHSFITGVEDTAYLSLCGVVSIAHKLMLPFVKLYENIDAKMKKHKADLKTSPEMLYNNINNHGRNEMSVGNRIEGKIGKIQ